MSQARVVSAAPLRATLDSLAEPGWLAANIDDPSVRVVHVDVSPAAYSDGHIDGAVLWNVYADLKDKEYRLVDRSAFGRLLSRSAITPASTVVVYGYAPAMAFWLLKLYGHRDVRILNCSLDTWRGDGHPWNRDATTSSPTRYRFVEQDRSIRAGRAEVEEAMHLSSATLVDVRSEAEYRGERFWPSGAPEPNGRAGHIPGAVHHPIDDLYDSRGAFRPTAELRSLFSALDAAGDGPLITYCTIGGRAATAWFVLTHLIGRDHVRVYDGSWAEWGHAADTPIEAV